jgi:hypothetical protein
MVLFLLSLSSWISLNTLFYEDITDKAKGVFPIWSSIQDRIRI